MIGSVLLLRAEALRQVGGFDDAFFLYAEETDWACRAPARLASRPRRHGDARCTSAPARAPTLVVARCTSTPPRSATSASTTAPGGGSWRGSAQLCGAIARALVLPTGRARDSRERALLYARGPMRVEIRQQRDRLPGDGPPVEAT